MTILTGIMKWSRTIIVSANGVTFHVLDKGFDQFKVTIVKQLNGVELHYYSSSLEDHSDVCLLGTSQHQGDHSDWHNEVESNHSY